MPLWMPARISIHALREEGDVRVTLALVTLLVFLSTPSARRATSTFAPSSVASPYFYPRPPRGGRPVKRAVWAALMAISIHALREEGDSSG